MQVEYNFTKSYADETTIRFENAKVIKGIREGYKLADRKEIPIEELSDYPCVLFDQSDDSNFYLTEEVLADYDFKKLIKSTDRPMWRSC